MSFPRRLLGFRALRFWRFPPAGAAQVQLPGLGAVLLAPHAEQKARPPWIAGAAGAPLLSGLHKQRGTKEHRGLPVTAQRGPLCDSEEVSLWATAALHVQGFVYILKVSFLELKIIPN